MANISGASLTQIQQRLRDTPAYHPFDADTFCDWAMEAGDIVTVRRGEESYQSPIHSSHLVWRGKQNMELNASGTKERDAIARVSKQKYARGGYGMRQQKSLYYEFYSEDGYLHGLFEVSESHMRSEFEDVANSLRGEFEVTASHMRSEFEDVANGLRGEFEVTASHLRSEFNDTANSLRGEFEVTASHLRGEFEDVANSLRGDFEVTASHLRGEFNDAANSLRGEFEVTASHLRGEFEDANNSLRGEFEVTAASLRAQFEDTSNSLRSSIEAEAGRIGLVVEGYGADASVKRASLILAINNGTSSAHLDADQVYIGNEKSTTVINGKLNASDVTADYIQGKIADISTLQVNGITSSGSVSFSGTTTLSGSVQIQGSDGNTRNLATGIRTLYKASESEGVVTLQYIDFNGTTHDVTFNKAVATISGSWSDGTLTVSKDPNGSSTYSSVIDSVLANGQVTYANQILTVPVTVRVRNNGGSQSETGYSGTLAVGAGLAYTAGQNSVNVNAGSWDSGSITFLPSAGTGSSASTSIDAVLSNGQVTYANQILTVPVKVMAKVNNGSQTETGYTTTLSVGAGLAYTAGQNSVNVDRGTWDGGQITFSPSAGTGATKVVTLSKDSASWSNATCTIVIKDTTANQNAYTTTVTAPLEEREVTITPSTSQSVGTYTPTSGKIGMSKFKVTVNAVSHAITSFNTTAPSGQTSGSLKNNSDGYVLSGSGSDATAYIVVKGTWKCDGVSKEGTSYLQSAPTLLYKKGYGDGQSSISVTISADSTSLNANTSTTVRAKKNGTDAATVTVSAKKVQTSCSTFTGVPSDPGSSYTERTISPGYGTNWFTFKTEGTNGGTAANYKLKVNGPSDPAVTIGASHNNYSPLAYSGSVTITAYKAGSSAGSITVTAPADRYDAGYSAALSDIAYARADSSHNRWGDYYNCILYKSNGTAIKTLTATGTNTGMYIPMEDGVTLSTNNKWYYASPSSGYTTTKFGYRNFKISVPQSTSSAWLVAADSEYEYQGYLQYDQLYGVTLDNNIVATWRTPPKTSTSHTPTCGYSSPQNSAPSGAAFLFSAKSGTADKYWKITANCGGQEKAYYVKIEKA